MKMELHSNILKLRRAIPAALALAALLFAGCGKPADADRGEAHIDAGEVSFVSTAHTHENPEETCFICDPAKREKGRLWCREHGRYEDRCWLCHPELEDKERLYCQEHALYEDECFLCYPELKSNDRAALEETGEPSAGQEQAQVSAGLYCSEHDVFEIECAICQPDLAASLEPGGSLKIRFPSHEAADKAGIRTGRPEVSLAAPTIEAFCEVHYNLNTMAKITPFASGVIREVRYDLGEKVEAGDALVVLHSNEVAATKSAFLSAIVERENRRQAFERERRLQEQKISAEKDFLTADAAYRTAQLDAANLRQQLLNLGLTNDEIAEVEQTRDTSARLVVRAPFDGTLIERNAFVGEMVEVGKPVFTIADLSTRWLVLSVSSSQAEHIAPGQEVEASFSELPGIVVKGRVTWIDTSVDSRTRMVRVRAVVTEGADRIKNGLFGEARIKTGDSNPAIMVPFGSVQRHEGGAFVFVRNQPDLFSLRRVALGQSNGDTVAVLAGLDATDAVVMDGSFIVMSEFLKSRLGAGCADH